MTIEDLDEENKVNIQFKFTPPINDKDKHEPTAAETLTSEIFDLVAEASKR